MALNNPTDLKAALSTLGLRLNVEGAAPPAKPGIPIERLLGKLDHPKQLAFAKDPAKRKCCVAGRRGGKTEAAGAWLVEPAWQRPNEMSIFVARTLDHARSIMWPVLQRLNREFNLHLRFNENLLTATFPSNYRIRLHGADTRNDVEKFRGPRYVRAVLDECGSWPPELLEYVVQSILDPALMDLDGELAIIGSPGVVPIGFFFDKSEGSLAWPTHRFDCRDNPYVKGAPYLEQKLLENGWNEDHPTFQREYLGLWVKDQSALVCPYSHAINDFADALPPGSYSWAISVDLGAGEKPTTAFSVGAARQGFPEVYVREVTKHSHMTPSRIAVEVELLKQKHCPDVPCQVIIDEGGLGVGYAEELRARYGVMCKAAEKKKRRAFQEILAGDMKSGVIRCHPSDCSEFIDEVAVLKWNEDRSNNSPDQPDHAYDSVLYLVRALRTLYRPELEPPPEGSAAAMALVASAEKEEARRRGLKKLKDTWKSFKRGDFRSLWKS